MNKREVLRRLSILCSMGSVVMFLYLIYRAVVAYQLWGVDDVLDQHLTRQIIFGLFGTASGLSAWWVLHGFMKT